MGCGPRWCPATRGREIAEGLPRADSGNSTSLQEAARGEGCGSRQLLRSGRRGRGPPTARRSVRRGPKTAPPRSRRRAAKPRRGGTARPRRRCGSPPGSGRRSGPVWSRRSRARCPRTSPAIPRPGRRRTPRRRRPPLPRSVPAHPAPPASLPLPGSTPPRRTPAWSPPEVEPDHAITAGGTRRDPGHRVRDPAMGAGSPRVRSGDLERVERPRTLGAGRVSASGRPPRRSRRPGTCPPADAASRRWRGRWSAWPSSPSPACREAASDGSGRPRARPPRRRPAP